MNVNETLFYKAVNPFAPRKTVAGTIFTMVLIVLVYCWFWYLYNLQLPIEVIYTFASVFFWLGCTFGAQVVFLRSFLRAKKEPVEKVEEEEPKYIAFFVGSGMPVSGLVSYEDARNHSIGVAGGLIYVLPEKSYKAHYPEQYENLTKG